MDVLCLDDLDAFGTELDDPLAELLQDDYHRLIEAPGSNPDDPNRGLGLEDLLSAAIAAGPNAPSDAVDLASLGPRIETELLNDDRNADVRATLSVLEQTARGTTFAIDVEIVSDQGLAGRLGITAGPDGVRRVL